MVYVDYTPVSTLLGNFWYDSTKGNIMIAFNELDIWWIDIPHSDIFVCQTVASRTYSHKATGSFMG